MTEINNEEKTKDDIILDVLKDLLNLSLETVAEFKESQILKLVEDLKVNHYTKEYIDSLPPKEAEIITNHLNSLKGIGHYFTAIKWGMFISNLYEAAEKSNDDVAKEIFTTVLGSIVVGCLVAKSAPFWAIWGTVFLVDELIDKNWDVIRDSGVKAFIASGIPTIIEKVSEGIDAYKITTALDKFYEEVDSDFDYSKGTIDIITKSSDGFYLKITDGVKNYIFDDDYNSSITGSAIDDIVYLGNGRNVINSGAGNDTIYGGDGVDVVHGGADDDRIITGKGNDIIFGGTGINYIEPGEGNNEIYCEAA